MRIGEKIKRLRLENGLTQEELANRCELSKGFISQVERDMTSPSIASLVDILESLGTNLNEFFSEMKKKSLFSPQKMPLKTSTKNLATYWTGLYQTLKKNAMEPILLKNTTRWQLSGRHTASRGRIWLCHAGHGSGKTRE